MSLRSDSTNFQPTSAVLPSRLRVAHHLTDLTQRLEAAARERNVCTLCLRRVDPHVRRRRERRRRPPKVLAHHPHRRHSSPGTQLHHGHVLAASLGSPPQEGIHALLLCLRPPSGKVQVAEHQDVRPCSLAARKRRQRRFSRAHAQRGGVDVEAEVGGHRLDRDTAQPLQVVDGAVALHHRVLREARLLKVPVDVRREDERILPRQGAPLFENGEPRVRHGRAVQLQAVAVEAPGKGRVGVEPRRVGHRGEANTEVPQGRVVLPQPLVASKVRQAGVDAHPGTGGDDDHVGPADSVRGLSELGGQRCHLADAPTDNEVQIL
eukprot:Rhum_TRINITY_DN14803_c0_g2::Rhum_TRINITY_DN14803_c0_g2_i1::g.119649::m.119649